MRLGTNEIFETVRSISYKPNWKIKAKVEYDAVFIGIEIIDVMDRDTLKPIQIFSKFLIPFHFLESSDDLIKFIRYKIRDVEEHEADEWFKVNGIRIKDGHHLWACSQPHNQG